MISIFGPKYKKINLFKVSNNLIETQFSILSKHLVSNNFRHFYCPTNQLSKPIDLNNSSDKFLTIKSFNGKILIRELWGMGIKKAGEIKPGVRSKDVALAGRLFKEIPDRHKEHFLQVVDNFGHHKFVKRQGYVEFITAALPYLKEFGVHKDIEVYKALMNVFPKGKLRPDNVWAAGFFHFPLEQRTGVEILCAMEDNGVMPDKEMETLIISIFSKYSSPWRKCARMTYWMTKFMNANPFPLPNPLPLDALELSLLAIKRMCIDVQTKISVLSSAQIQDSIDKTWIVSGQSPQQQEIVNELPTNESIYVEGPFKAWLRNMSIDYFMLRANNPNPVRNKDDDNIDNDEFNDVSSLPLSTFGKEHKEQVLSPNKNIHIQDDGKILALCATGTSSRDSLLSWVRLLQSSNPKLKVIPIVFTLRGLPSDLQTITPNESQKAQNK